MNEFKTQGYIACVPHADDTPQEIDERNQAYADMKQVLEARRAVYLAQQRLSWGQRLRAWWGGAK